MKGIQLARQVIDVVVGHRPGAGVAVAGGDAVDHTVFFQQLREKTLATFDAGAEFRARRQRDATAALSDGENILQRQGCAIQDQGGSRLSGVGHGHWSRRQSRKGKS